MITALLTASAAFLIYLLLALYFFPPPPKPAPTSAPSAPTVSVREAPASGRASSSQSAPSSSLALSEEPARGAVMQAAEQSEDIVIGNEQTALRAVFTPRGAAILELFLTNKNKNGRYTHRVSADKSDPFRLLAPVTADRGTHASFETHKLWIRELGDRDWDLRNLRWKVADRGTRHIEFQTALASPETGELVRFSKRYTLRGDAPFIDLQLTATNAGGTPLSITLAQDGPLGVPRDDLMYDMRKIVLAQRSQGVLALTAKARNQLTKEATLVNAQEKLAWLAQANKYFGAYMRPVGEKLEDRPDAVQRVTGVALSEVAPDSLAPADFVARCFLMPATIEPGASSTTRFEIYAGPKDADWIRPLGAQYVDHTKIGYDLAGSVDSSCWCAFDWLKNLMTWLLRTIYLVVRNYGVAIMILVVIVRGLLHPLAVWQQKSMYRLQDGMARLQPKLNEIKQKYANDQVKQQQEQLRLMAAEGVNPASGMVSMLPMMLQMPILIALWNALNTDIEMRLAPFDGWWIRDLSAPDSLISFGGKGITVPVLEWFPLIGTMFQNIPAFNILPFFMGLSIWLQQRYMPKPPALLKALEESKKNPQAAPMGGMSPEEQLRQQQMMATMMAFMLPVMLYYQPSGLILYWLASNVFGIFESLRIRKQLAEEKKRVEALGPAAIKPRQPGIVGRFMQRLAEQAEEIQRKADEVSAHPGPSAPRKRGK